MSLGEYMGVWLDGHSKGKDRDLLQVVQARTRLLRLPNFHGLRHFEYLHYTQHQITVYLCTLRNPRFTYCLTAKELKDFRSPVASVPSFYVQWQLKGREAPCSKHWW